MIIKYELTTYNDNDYTKKKKLVLVKTEHEFKHSSIEEIEFLKELTNLEQYNIGYVLVIKSIIL